MDIHTHRINNVSLATGDLICTTDGGGDFPAGQFWRLIGRLIPGDVDHIVIYIGPKGRCVEAGAKGKVIAFEASAPLWNSLEMAEQRGLFSDELYGVAYPLADMDKTEDEINRIRSRVADYCLAQIGKPYNLNFFDSNTESAFYCSQLAYKAYLECGINLNFRMKLNAVFRSESIIFPQEIWDGCSHERAR